MTDPGLDLGAYLAQLEGERGQLDIIIADVRRRLGITSSDSGGNGGIMQAAGLGGREATGPGKVRSDEFFRMSIPEAIRRYLEIMKAPQAPTAIVGALKAGGVLSESKNFYTTVSTAIKRLRKAGEVVNTRTGWGLSDWYPNRPKGAVEDKRPKKGKQKKGRKAAAKPSQVAQSPKEDAGVGSTPKGGYNAFVAEQRKAGKSLKEIGEAWQKSKTAG